ncbi:uncharacterized protein LOC114532446 [Dendronephthya gigantea]|uniref:uncharacterized protein LOC114532446 n=1 Tax=Dendronephthya gigantea TaxID=151771 RepID=UPI00106C25C1|nr:uncharacterized protein LOC114532446 [Dendronephthya gigantea]
MHIRILTRRVFTPLQLFVVIFIVFDANAKPAALNVNDENLLDNGQTLRAAKLTKLGDGVYKCNHHHQPDKHYQQTDDYHHHRKRRFTASPFKFNTMVVLWHVTNFSSKLPQDVQLNVFTEAFNKWDVVSRLKFSYTANANAAHIKIKFLQNDGPGGTLAHAFDPHSSNGSPGQIHFDEDENWVTTTTGGVNLKALALHEIGHAIGIKHSDVDPSIMKDVISNDGTELFDDDIAAIRWMYGKCEVRDLTAVLHDRYGASSDTVLVINKDKIWRIRVNGGEIENEENEKWPKDVRDFYRATDPMYDKVFPLRGAMYIQHDNDVYLFGQKHFIRKKTWNNDQMTDGRFYDFKDLLKYEDTWDGSIISYVEGPLSYNKSNNLHTPDMYKKFLQNNAKFGASFETDCCFWQHFFLNGMHYKISSHDFSLLTSEDMSVNFSGAPRDPDASWYDSVNNEWYFFKADKYYRKDNSTGLYTDRGPISLLWFPVCD